MVRKLPSTLYRCKGIIYTAECPNNRVILQIVGRRIDVTVYDEWGNRSRQTQIVAISTNNGINAELLKQYFDSCLFDNYKSAT